MLSSRLKTIYQQYLPRYRSELKSFSPFKLHQLVQKAAKEAKENYQKLSEPRTCSINVYIKLWVRQTLDWDLATKTVKKVSIDNSSSFGVSVKEYFSLFPDELSNEFRKKLFDAKPEMRKGVWKSFKLPFGEIEKRFVKMTKERIKFARKRGYPSYVDMFLERDKIPYPDYKYFTQNADKIIEYCNQQLPETDNLPSWFYSEYNLPCFICKIPLFPFKSFNEVIDYFVERYPLFSKFKHKVSVKLGKSSSMFYKKETDSFQITIDKNLNIRHQIVELIHELGHVVRYLQNFNRGINPLERGIYLREKEAFKIELANLEAVSPNLFRALFSELLLLFNRVLFEIELYANPNQDLSRLYAKTFNRCFKKAKQKTNPLYILDEHIVLKPLSSLPQAIASAELLSTID